MIRKFALITFDKNTDVITDRINLDIVSAPSGLGFSVTATTIKTDVEEILIKAVQSLGTISLTVNFANGNEYVKARALRAWIEKHINDRTAIEWQNDAGLSYADCIVTDFEFGELAQRGLATVPLKIKMLSPFFEIVENEIKIYPSTGGKIYPYTYPYTYGSGVIANNEIANNYIKEIPLIITLYGVMDNVSCGIRVKGESELYQQVAFEGLSLQANQYIIVNAVTRKILYFNGTELTDGYNYLDASKDSFIYAKENAISELTANVESGKTGRLTASYVLERCNFV